MRSLFVALPLLVLAACQSQSSDTTTAQVAPLPPVAVDAAVPPATAGPAPVAADSAAPFWVEPGRSLARLRLGADAGTALAPLGKPSFGDAAMQKAWATWYGRDSARTQLDVYTAPRNNDVDHHTVQLVRTTSREFRLPNSLGVGSLLAEIQAAYGQLPLAATYQLTAGPRYLYDDVKRGVAFETDGQAAGSRCRALIVHLSGQAVASAALPMPEYLKQLK
ncbi:hypothetical protein Q5H93_01955 [Hymenobacter sp. ASUV-10]|uniref:Lipoprotein n=1 Tax=Hymenobacter aranciens TaxID=3063996 RepID=A0ABT9BA99_9BACT|nr:hypothetical protein [Hymenobacter sp. ASUV-10]MDO7873478.1 hypothetical protein [Hymenobacter sp. ASUV-10]